jgi:hypothetical protein
LFSEWGS